MHIIFGHIVSFIRLVMKNKEVYFECYTHCDQGCVSGDGGALPETVGDIPQRKQLLGEVLELRVHVSCIERFLALTIQ